MVSWNLCVHEPLDKVCHMSMHGDISVDLNADEGVACMSATIWLMSLRLFSQLCTSG